MTDTHTHRRTQPFIVKDKNELKEQRLFIDDEGINIKTRDVKKKIHMNNVAKFMTFDLIVRDAQTNEEYSDDDLIRKNTHLVIQRVPLSDGQKKIRKQEFAVADSNDSSDMSSEDSEEEKLNKMMSNSMYFKE